MCSEKMIADIDAGKIIMVKKGWFYLISFLISSGILAWLIGGIFWIAGTDNSIAKNSEAILKVEKRTTEVVEWQDEMIYNLTRLLESNGLDWKSFKK